MIDKDTLLAPLIKKQYGKLIFNKGKEILFDLEVQSIYGSNYGHATLPEDDNYPTVTLTSSSLKYKFLETLVHEFLHLTGETHDLTDRDSSDESFNTYGFEVIYQCAAYAIWQDDALAESVCSKSYLQKKAFEGLLLHAKFGASMRLKDLNKDKVYYYKMRDPINSMYLAKLLMERDITPPIELLGYRAFESELSEGALRLIEHQRKKVAKEISKGGLVDFPTYEQEVEYACFILKYNNDLCLKKDKK